MLSYLLLSISTDSSKTLRCVCPALSWLLGLIFAGPGYWLSVCSTSSLAWVQRQVGSDEFAEIAQELQDGWRKHLRLQHEEPPLKSAEPEPQVAWKYCNGMS